MRICLALLLLAGCNGSTSAPSGPTWYQDVAPLVSARCTGCHTTGGIGPFSLTDGENARRYAPAMVAQVQAGLMPPWHALETDQCKPRFPFQGDPRLTADERSLLERWAQAGAPLGDASKAAALPAPPSRDLANRNERVAMAAPYLVQGNRDVFRCFSLPYEFAEEAWLTGLQVVPGNGKVVHHVLVWLDDQKQGEALAQAQGGSYECFGAPGFNAKLLGAWAPGAMATEAPPDTAIPIPKGSKIVINVHYHPGANPESDLSSLDLRWSTTRPRYQALLALVGNAQNAKGGLLPGPDDPATGPAFVIPPGTREHTEDMAFTIPQGAVVPGRIFSVATHMHYVGVDMRVEIDRTTRTAGAPADEPGKECLVETPHWDFHWQRGYSYAAAFDQLPTLQAGDVLRLHCRYDNTMQNRFVAAALAEQGLKEPREVRLGEQTLDEMCIGGLGVAFPLPPAPTTP
jgi:hypothetical protein